MKKTLLACLFGLGLGACVNAADVQEINIAYVKAPFNLQNIVMKHNQMMEKALMSSGTTSLPALNRHKRWRPALWMPAQQ